MATGASIRSGALWSALLNIGGVLLLAGSLAYSVMTLQDYEDRYGPLNGGGDQEALDRNATDAAPDSPEQNESEAPPEIPDAEATAKVAELTRNLDDVRGKLADAEGRNATLQQRVDELEQQGASAESNLAQCRDKSVKRINELQGELDNCQQRLAQQPPVYNDR